MLHKIYIATNNQPERVFFMGHWLYHPESECVYYKDDMKEIEKDVQYGVDILSDKGKEDSLDDLKRCLILEKVQFPDSLQALYGGNF